MRKKWLVLSLLMTPLMWAGACESELIKPDDPNIPDVDDPIDPNDPNDPIDPNDPDPPKIPDADGDTISDIHENREQLTDTDGDTVPDYLDLDSDGDTIPDAIEAGNGGNPKIAPVDSDGDTVPDFRSLDSDANGILDADEAKLNADGKALDTDGDTIPDFQDADNDGDGVNDIDEINGLISLQGNHVGADCNGDGVPDEPGSVENPFDCDGDTVPDYMDVDSDGDGINDIYEGYSDSNGNGFYDRYSLDSDGDTIPDADERGCEPGGKPVDTDGDGQYDFQDSDSDNDGIADELEVDCPSLGKHSRLFVDTDGDGYSDLAEYVMAKENGLDPEVLICDPARNPKEFVDFYFELPFSGDEKTDSLVFEPQITKADVFLNIDNTGSMGTTIDALKEHFASVVIDAVRERVPDSHFGFSVFRDWDTTPVWALWQALTSDASAFMAKLKTLSAKTGTTDDPEAGYEALYQIATGAGLPAGESHFRTNALPVIIHITDERSHDPMKENSVTSAVAFQKLRAIGARVIQAGISGVSSNNPAWLLAEGVKMAEETGALVPVCAFKYQDSGEWICGKNKCCTNALYDNMPPSKNPYGLDPDANGNCTLSFDVDLVSAVYQEKNALAYKTMAGVEALVRYATYDVSTRIIGQSIPADEREGEADTSCFIQRIEAESYTPPNKEPVKSCVPKAVPKAFGDKGYNDGFTNFAVGAAKASEPKSKLSFKVVAKNTNCVKPSTLARNYKATIEVFDPITGQIFDTHEVSVIVPGTPKQYAN